MTEELQMPTLIEFSCHDRISCLREFAVQPSQPLNSRPIWHAGHSQRAGVEDRAYRVELL
jgi:hypothetical protein